ncbi:uncharacterized protein LOC103317094 [Nasonia vitripennis]|uniref:Uncharacterized protein n=1 Tax=Nasonia vitripennis TaxID=7425 RepID=A0A7M7M2L2_NASVI|nr:uncharacterized protein LOC103317094 [Nasonia vitripennis]
MNTRIPILERHTDKPSTLAKGNEEADDSREQLKAVSKPVSRKQELEEDDQDKESNYNPSEVEDDDYDDEYESNNGTKKRKRKSSAAASKFDSEKTPRKRWTAEQEDCVAPLYAAYIRQGTITNVDIQKLIDDNC